MDLNLPEGVGRIKSSFLAVVGLFPHIHNSTVLADCVIQTVGSCVYHSTKEEEVVVAAAAVAAAVEVSVVKV